MKLIFCMLLLILTSIEAVGQRSVRSNSLSSVEVQKGQLTVIKIFNCSSTPVAIKSSSYFNNFSEEDTLDIAPLQSSKLNEYNLGLSFKESKEEGARFYRLVIVNPQTYLIINTRLVGYDTTKGGKFYFEYTFDFTEEESRKFTKKGTSEIIMLNTKRSFSNRIIDIDSIRSTINICNTSAD